MSKKMPDSVYCKLLKLTRQKEDFFTESLAYALQKDQGFLRSFVQLLAGETLADIEQAVFEVKTQVPVPFGRLDMVLVKDGRTNLVIENKLWSKEGEDQLFKYLSNEEIHHLAFITAEGGYKVDSKVLNSHKYLRPVAADHFTWEDVMPVLERACGEGETHYTLAELRSLFAYLGFGRHFGDAQAVVPKPVNRESLKIAGEYEELAVYDRKSAENIFTLQTPVQNSFEQLFKSNKPAFAQVLSTYRWGGLGGQKYLDIGNKHGQIYAYNLDINDDSTLVRLYITPTKEGNALRIRLSTHNKANFPVFVDELEKSLDRFSLLYELNADTRRHELVEVVLPLTGMPDDLNPAAEYLLGLLDIVLKSAQEAVECQGMR